MLSAVRRFRMALKDDVSELVQTPIEEEGFELVELKLAQYKKSSRLQFFIDSENGVNIDDCVRVSRRIEPVIEASNLFAFGYTIEVSSPGLDRPLKTERDFSRKVGEKMRIFFVEDEFPPVEGVLIGVNETGIEVETENGKSKFDLGKIRVGKIIF